MHDTAVTGGMVWAAHVSELQLRNLPVHIAHPVGRLHARGTSLRLRLPSANDARAGSRAHVAILSVHRPHITADKPWSLVDPGMPLQPPRSCRRKHG
jgi:hypothetical protein